MRSETYPSFVHVPTHDAAGALVLVPTSPKPGRLTVLARWLYARAKRGDVLVLRGRADPFRAGFPAKGDTESDEGYWNSFALALTEVAGATGLRIGRHRFVFDVATPAPLPQLVVVANAAPSKYDFLRGW